MLVFVLGFFLVRVVELTADGGLVVADRDQSPAPQPGRRPHPLHLHVESPGPQEPPLDQEPPQRVGRQAPPLEDGAGALFYIAPPRWPGDASPKAAKKLRNDVLTSVAAVLHEAAHRWPRCVVGTGHGAAHSP